MLTETILTDWQIDEPFLHRVRGSLDATCGLPFEFWLPGERWTQLEFDPWRLGGEPPEDLWATLDQACRVNGRPAFGQTAQGPVLALPIVNKMQLKLVATARPLAISDHLVRLAAAFLRELALQEELARHRSTNEAYAVEMTRSFEELHLLCQLSQYLDLSDVARPWGQLASDTLTLLQDIIGAACVMWIAADASDRRPTRGAGTAGEVLAGSGLHTCHRTVVQRLVERYGSRATTQPVVRNHVQDSPEAAELAGVRSFLLTSANSGQHNFGWILAINRPAASVAGDPENVASADDQEFGSVEAGLVNTVASILATHARNVQLFQENEQTLLGAVRSLVAAIEAKDRYTRGHSERVGLFARRLGEELQFEQTDAKQLYLAGLLHDVGKIAIQGATLRKPGRLSDEEFAEIQQHPQVGWEILYDLGRLEHLLPAVVHHHEHFNGAGYPDGLQGHEIPYAARILAVADTYDALTSDRPYRPGMPQERAEAILREGAGSQWDPVVIDALFAALPDILRIRQEYRARCPPQRQARQYAVAQPAPATGALGPAAEVVAEAAAADGSARS